MRHLFKTPLILVGAVGLFAQGRPVDWSFFGGDAQRTGWEKADSRITRENVKDFRLVLKQKLENGPGGPRSLTPPVVIGNLISYRGFKELGFVAGSSGELWSIDLDMDRIFWKKHLSSPSSVCASVAPGTMALTPPTNFAARPRPAAAGPARSPGAPPTPAGAPPAAAPPAATRGVLGSTAFGSPRPAFAVSNDGKLHILNTSTGDDLVAAVPFLPANAKASSLVISDGVIYTTTDGNCPGTPAGVWAIDLTTIDPKDGATITPQVHRFAPDGETLPPVGGAVFGSDGTVYVQTSRTLHALHAKDLAETRHVTVAGEISANPATPVIFSHEGKDMIATSGADGNLYLFDAQALDTPVAQVHLGDVRGGMSTFQDAAGVRWIVAPVWASGKGFITALRVEQQNGKLALSKGWVSREMNAPATPVITSGVVFALSTGGHAVLYALDAETGKELYSTGNQMTAPGQLTGLTVANGRVFFTTTDNTLYGFGIYLER